MMKLTIEQLKKNNMVINRRNSRVSLTIIILSFSFILSGQTKGKVVQFSESYCTNEVGKLISDSTFLWGELSDTVFLAYQNIGDEQITFELFNTTNDTIYLFSSYIQDEYYPASCLQRVNDESLEYKVSFIPILPFLGIKTSDTKILSSDRVCSPFQVRYEFIKLPPNTFFGFGINVKRLFSKTLDKEKVFKDFDPYSVNKFTSNFQLSVYDFGRISKCLDLIFEVAIFHDVSLICDGRSFYFNEFEFDKKSKDFEIHKVSVGSNYFRSRLY